MKRLRWISSIAALALLTACVPSQKKEDSQVMTDESKEVETTIIPSMQLDERYYKTLIPYKESASRGLVVSNLYTKYDIKEVEAGLMRLSQNVFNTDDYFFQEGQYLDANTVSNWLARENQNKDKDPSLWGLNPPNVDDKGVTLEPEVRAKEAPIYLAHIVEQNYLRKTNDNKVGLGGVSIGLALNSVYYYQKEQYGEYYSEPIDDDVLEQKGKEIAQEILNRLRARPELMDVPIVIGLFKQEERKSIVPGTYFAYSVSDSGQNSLGEWKTIDEEYVTFPTSLGEEYYRELNSAFVKFKEDINKYFSNYTSVIGTGHYINKQLQKIKIEIPIQFYGTTEIIGFTQYLSGIMLTHLPKNVDIEVNISSINGPEALILKERNEAEPFVHIYSY